jgi:hypothetical protein
MARGAERLLGIGSQPFAYELGHGGLAQPARLHRNRDGILGDLGEQPGVGRSGGRGDEDLQALEPVLQVRDETQRRLIAPMQVVDQQQQRSVGGDVRRDPEKAVEHAEGDVGLGAGVVGRLEHPRRRLRGAGQPPRPVGRIDQHGLEQLPHDAERQLALEVAPAGGEHAEPGTLGRFASRGEEPALPDPGRSLDECQAGPAVERALDQVLERTELAVALEEVARRRRRSSCLAVDRHRRALSGLPLRDPGPDLVHLVGRDVVHAVLLARMHDDLPEDLLVGFPAEGRPASGHQRATAELLHVQPSLVRPGA